MSPLLEVQGLTKSFAGRPGLFGWRRTGPAHLAVDDVGFTVLRGETFGIVGESGSGKSTTARLIMRLIEPTAGSVRFDGEELIRLDAEALRRRRRGIQMVFQDPFASLNPRLSVRRQLAEPIVIHGLARGAAIDARVDGLLARVGLRPEHAHRYPHEFSGGQRQRLAIARALAAEPQLIIADEAVSALDVSVRAQILNLLAELQESTGVAMIFISHDLAVVRHIAQRVAVIQAGRIVEEAPTERIFASPEHPYTRKLLASMPRPPEPAAASAERIRRLQRHFADLAEAG
jgi:ABC-type glutathione transport system ATPase component